MTFTSLFSIPVKMEQAGLRKAKLFIQASEICQQQGHYDSATSRCYYAVYRDDSVDKGTSKEVLSYATEFVEKVQEVLNRG